MKIKNVLSVTAVAFIAGAAIHAIGQPVIDGTLDGSYGSALSVQTVATDYGSQTAASGGSQLDAAYGVIQGGNLDIFLAGNTSDGNNLVIYLADGAAGGESTFNVSGGSYTSTGTQNLDGSVFSPGFSATDAIDVNTYSGTIYANIFDLVAGVGGYAGSAPDAGGTIVGSDYSVTLAVNESSAAGTGNNTGSGALSVTTGWELQIPISALNDSSSIEVLAGVGSDNSSSLSDQFLAPANVSGYPATFNFGSTPDEYFTVTAPEPASLALFGLSGLTTLLAIRRRK
jgi:hypothetical protein